MRNAGSFFFVAIVFGIGWLGGEQAVNTFFLPMPGPDGYPSQMVFETLQASEVVGTISFFLIVILGVFLIGFRGEGFLADSTVSCVDKVVAWYHKASPTPKPEPERWSWWDESRREDNAKLDDLYRKEWEGKDL